MRPDRYETIRFDTDGRIATLAFNRPEKLNAISHRMASEIAEAASQLDSARVLIVTGNERAFSAGADLSERAEPGRTTTTIVAYDALASVPIPVIAAIEGYALGGGLELAMCCDLRVASETARLGQPEVLRGILPGGGGTQRLPRLIGPSRAKDLMFTGRHITGATAEQWGLVNLLTPPGEALARAREIAEDLATRSGPLALKEIKNLVDRGLDLPLDEGLAIERQRAAFLYTTEDSSEGIQAFLDRREPDFRGR
ncbi:MAG: enoyl-CoA hydratase/isomerase family protein [Thermomicrobiales bacterium]